MKTENMIKQQQFIMETKRNEIVSWIKAMRQDMDIALERMDRGLVDDFCLSSLKSELEEAYRRLNEYKIADEKIKMLEVLNK